METVLTVDGQPLFSQRENKAVKSRFAASATNHQLSYQGASLDVSGYSTIIRIFTGVKQKLQLSDWLKIVRPEQK